MIAVGLLLAGATTATADVSVTAGAGFSCAITPTSEIECWGANEDGESDPPEGRFLSLSAGSGFACGIRINRRIACWGRRDSDRVTTAPRGRFRSLSTGTVQACAVRLMGWIVCWGRDLEGDTHAPRGRYISVGAGTLGACGLRRDRQIACWGGEVAARQPPAGPFRSLSVGSDAACGLRSGGAVDCWAYPIGGVWHVPDTYLDFVWGYEWWCGIHTDTAALQCGGYWQTGLLDTPAGRYKSLDAPLRGDHACAVRESDGIVCWGKSDRGQTDVPEHLR